MSINYKNLILYLKLPIYIKKHNNWKIFLALFCCTFFFFFFFFFFKKKKKKKKNNKKN